MKKLPDDIVKNLQLTLTKISIDRSAIMGCVFYTTIFDDIFLTNYDITINNYFSNPDLSKNGFWILYAKRKGYFASIKISEELILDGHFKLVLQYFSSKLDGKLKK